MAFPIVVATGGPRERGRAVGTQAADRVHRTVALYEEVFAHYAGLTWEGVRARAGAFVPFIDAFDVTLLPELEGIAEGARLDAEDVLAVNLRTEIMFGLDARPGRAALKECTAMATAGPAPLVGQTWDWKPATRDTVILLACVPHDGPGFVSVVEAGLWAKCGMNEAGLALATNALQSSRDRGEPGVPYHADPSPGDHEPDARGGGGRHPARAPCLQRELPGRTSRRWHRRSGGDAGGTGRGPRRQGRHPRAHEPLRVADARAVQGLGADRRGGVRDPARHGGGDAGDGDGHLGRGPPGDLPLTRGRGRDPSAFTR